MTEWIWWAGCGRNVLPSTTPYPEATRPDDCSNSAGVEHLQTNLCRALGRIYPRLSSYNRRYYDGLVHKMLACGNPDQLGYIEYHCLRCGEGTHRVAMSG